MFERKIEEFDKFSKLVISEILNKEMGIPSPVDTILFWVMTVFVIYVPTKILHFIDNLHVIKDNLFEIPIVFDLIQSESSTSWKEMYQVFNMGHRMELYVDNKYSNEIIKISKSFGVDAKVIGRVESSTEKKLTISSKYGKFEYK